jgi:hypothetical protein
LEKDHNELRREFDRKNKKRGKKSSGSSKTGSISSVALFMKRDKTEVLRTHADEKVDGTAEDLQIHVI